MRWNLAIIASVALLAGCTAPPASVARDTRVVPHELIQQYTQSCVLASAENGGTGELSWFIGEDGATVDVFVDSPENRAAAAELEACLDRYDYEIDSPMAYVSAFERAELYEYYTDRTRPCLADKGIEIPDLPRGEFLAPDQRAWNPYPEMDDLPFDELLTLYRECPPVPDYVLSRHVTSRNG